MKTKMLVIPFLALLLSFATTGCDVHRPYDPYYNTRYRKEYKRKYKHQRDRDYDRDDRYSNRY